MRRGLRGDVGWVARAVKPKRDAVVGGWKAKRVMSDGCSELIFDSGDEIESDDSNDGAFENPNFGMLMSARIAWSIVYIVHVGNG